MEATVQALAFEAPARSRLSDELQRLAGLAQRVLASDVAVVYMWAPGRAQPGNRWLAGDQQLEPEVQRAVAARIGASGPTVLAGELVTTLVTPIDWDHATVGALCVASRGARVWTEREHADLADLAALVATEMRLLSLASELEETSARCERSDAALRVRDFELGERIKEQTCLYAVSAALRSNAPLAAALQRVVGEIPAGWRIPEQTWVKLTVGDDVWLSPGFCAGHHRRSAPIEIDRRFAGRLEIHLGAVALHKGSAVMPEEHQLLDELAAIIGSAITRRRAQEALARSEALFRTVAEQSDDMLGILDADRRLRYASPAIRRTLGYEPDQILGHDLAEVIHPDDLERVTAALAALRERPGAHLRIDYRVRDAGGRWMTIESQARNLIDDPIVNGLLVTSRNISERIAAQERVRFQAHLLDVVEQAVVATDLEGRISYWNRHATTLHGWSASEAQGRPLNELVVPPESHPEFARGLAGVRQGHGFAGEVEGIDRNGERLALHVSMVPVTGEDGAIVGTVSVATDIRARKELESMLARSQRLESVGRLTGGIAHDFNNILTSIGGFARMLIERDLEAPVLADLREIAHATQRAGSLTHKLLAFSRQQVLSPRVVDLSGIVRSMQSMFRPLIGEHIELTTILDPELRPVRVDVTQIEQVLMNLILNARDAMSDGGRLLIETANVEIDEGDAARTSGQLAPGPHVVLRVRERGCGMDAETTARIFDPFFTTKPAGQGSGLGLSTVFGIVSQSRGHVEVDSRPGRGTTFCIYLPAASEPAEQAPGSAASPRPDRGSETVLVVEDDRAVRSLIRRILQAAGYQVLLAPDGAEALRMMIDDGAQVDLVVSDVVMPRLGGRELVERIRSISPGTRALLMSGYTDDQVLLQGVDGRTCAFLGKPFSPVELTARVRQLLDETQER